MQVQRRMSELRGVGGKAAVYDATGGVLDAEGQTLRPGDVGELSEELARAFQHKLVKPGSQVAGEPVKPFAECALDFDAPKAKASKAKGTASGKGSSAT